MDDLAGYTGMKQFGSGHFMEPPENNNCGECNDTGHNVRTCKKRRTNTGTSQILEGAVAVEEGLTLEGAAAVEEGLALEGAVAVEEGLAL